MSIKSILNPIESTELTALESLTSDKSLEGLSVIERKLLEITPSKWRDAQNRRKLRTLFFEWNSIDPFYTLKDQDHKGYPSLKLAYIAAEDTTEYIFATTYLESWEHWTLLLDCPWFKPYVLRWRTELELKLKAEALRSIVEESKAGTRNSFQALKYIAEKGWIDKSTEPSRRGRPSKAEIARNAAEQVFNANRVQEDLKRLGLN